MDGVSAEPLQNEWGKPGGRRKMSSVPGLRPNPMLDGEAKDRYILKVISFQ
jgi:hypothetical protein